MSSLRIIRLGSRKGSPRCRIGASSASSPLSFSKPFMRQRWTLWSSGQTPPFPQQASLFSTWDAYESSHGSKLRALPEVRAVDNLMEFLKQKHEAGFQKKDPPMPLLSLSAQDYLTSLDAAMATFSLHVHARMASMVGHGFYTIGPCGEELLASAAMALEECDATALHYRHTAISMARQLQEQKNNDENDNDSSEPKSLKDILLARARGYTVSRLDPVTGGVHCSIGGGPNEYIVTSTLSSQCPPAVGRALGFPLAAKHVDMAPTKKKPISFVTMGDGSFHNHHCLSSLTLARHAKHLKIKCPVVFGISNNGLSISYQTKNYVDTVFPHGKENDDPLLPVFRADAQDLLSIYEASQKAFAYARKHQSPCVLLYSNIVRRFGHAATDRQVAYLDPDHIEAMADTCVLEKAMVQAVEDLQVTSYSHLLSRFKEIYQQVDDAFGQAITEPKVSLPDMMDRVSGPLVPIPNNAEEYKPNLDDQPVEKPLVMRKHMTRVLEEIMESDSSVVYLGEDVRHGGYYLVSEGLAETFPDRVLDFPPDETTLMGAALGFSQVGLTPIVEIPYAKYLDCGVDMFYEIAIQYWLTNSQRPNGMVVRLQGFDRGVFGGNFHTHNALSHMPPGVDVVCYSNGPDYVRGLRHAIHQAKHAGRVVMLVDCTNLLNLRHVHDRDRAWEFPYPTLTGGDGGPMMGFDEIRKHRYVPSPLPESGQELPAPHTAIVTYGNGVVTSLQARQDMVEHGLLKSEGELDIIDCPYLSGVPTGLEECFQNEKYERVLFADICKEGPGSNVFSSMIVALQENGTLPEKWAFVGAPRTYNPLGSTVTFLNRDTIEIAVEKILQQ